MNIKVKQTDQTLKQKKEQTVNAPLMPMSEIVSNFTESAGKT